MGPVPEVVQNSLSGVKHFKAHCTMVSGYIKTDGILNSVCLKHVQGMLLIGGKVDVAVVTQNVIVRFGALQGETT